MSCSEPPAGSSQSPGRADSIKVAAAALVIAVAALSLGDAMIKGFSLSLPLWQIFICRSLIALLPLLIFMKIRRAPFVPARAGWVALRSLLLGLMWVAYYIALPRMPFAVAAAALYTTPIIIALIAPITTGEPVRARGWIAVAAGFAVGQRPWRTGLLLLAISPITGT